jgi:hypothetical protein
MKKLFAPFILFALSGVLLTSCSNTSKLAFNKRHYRSGNFNDAVGKNHTLTPPVAKIATIASHPIPAIVKPENHVAVNTSVLVSQKPSINQNTITEKEPIGITTNSSKQVLSQTLSVTENPIIQTTQNISEWVGSPGNSSGDRGAALSLLWIVIVVILILWLIGILAGGFGLGGLINVLLIIALVLLILWLLRVW